ncbi:hypothetical protein Y032_0199g1669 [Ancylostoma ceylanicum]|uniref:Uncharacterized protein n=1 Tax=Ancylostoma ceylanicum TaxID=53326 RepID=A0A016SN45_9BILA|nr:hypothetical protein Y032_0199g1669 [Ancylostoma ceylanicum]
MKQINWPSFSQFPCFLNKKKTKKNSSSISNLRSKWDESAADNGKTALEAKTTSKANEIPINTTGEVRKLSVTCIHNQSNNTKRVTQEKSAQNNNNQCQSIQLFHHKLHLWYTYSSTRGDARNQGYVTSGSFDP